MTDPRDPGRDTRFARRHSVETPEHIVLRYDLAGVGSRAAAAIVDSILIVGIILVVDILALVIPAVSARRGTTAIWSFVLLVVMSLVVLWGYYALFEGFAGGRTPGKRALGIRVVLDDGRPITFGAAATRALLRLVDLQPGVTGLVGLAFIFFHPEHRRLGDLVAGTIVVRDRPETVGAAVPTIQSEPPPAPLTDTPARLSDEEFHLVGQFVARASALAPEARARLANHLIGRIADRFHEVEASDPFAFLGAVHELERTARAALAPAIRAGAGPAPQPASRGMRFAALKRPAWDAFARDAAAAIRSGLASRTGQDVRAFAARFREVSADLARARTYGVPPEPLAMLERAVAAGHDALYGGHRGQRVSFLDLLGHQFPAAVVRQRRYVLAAALCFTAPAVVGFAMLRQRPAAAYEVMPDVMLARAESGRQEQAQGRGYAQAPSPFLPLVATGIIANNVQVAAGAFAFGITFGIGTILVLLGNGLFFGASLGVFANYGLADWILTFVVGHGVLELTAIMIAGGGGLAIAHALIAPGDRLRRDAIVEAGRPALLMLGAAASLLVLAGTIEGFLSSSAAPPAFKLGVGAASLVLLLLYVLQGVAVNRSRPPS